MGPNDTVKIKPTQTGWAQIVAHVDAYNDDLRLTKCTFRLSAPVPDADGYITGQFWCLMAYFDWTSGIGSECPFYDMQIVKDI